MDQFLYGADILKITKFPMAHKEVNVISKPPKKRYLINGEFQSDAINDCNKDYHVQDPCSTLLEFAEICTSNAIRESATHALSSQNSAHTLSSSDLIPEDFKLKKNIFQNNVHKKEAVLLSQDQPLDLCKNKEKDEASESSKTITTSHQQLIEHFVDKFLCAKPASPNNYKPEFLDPVLAKLFSNKPCDTICLPDAKRESPTLTLSLAIESAVDMAYNSSNSKSTSVVPSQVISDSIKNENLKLNENIEDKGDINIETNFKSITKYPTHSSENTYGLNDKTKTEDSLNIKLNGSLSSNTSSSLSKLESANLNNTNCNSSSGSSKYFCKLISPPKKSSVWCNLFMNEQLTKSDINKAPSMPNTLTSDFQLPARRSSQRTCKGRRYQALITEGLLQSSKERKQNSNRKTISSNHKVKTKCESIIENEVFASKKKRKKIALKKAIL